MPKPVNKSIKEVGAQNLKDTFDSLHNLRTILTMLSISDDIVELKMASLLGQIRSLRSHLEDKHNFPRWIDTWGQPRFWKHPEE